MPDPDAGTWSSDVWPQPQAAAQAPSRGAGASSRAAAAQPGDYNVAMRQQRTVPKGAKGIPLKPTVARGAAGVRATATTGASAAAQTLRAVDTLVGTLQLLLRNFVKNQPEAAPHSKTGVVLVVRAINVAVTLKPGSVPAGARQNVQDKILAYVIGEPSNVQELLSALDAKTASAPCNRDVVIHDVGADITADAWRDQLRFIFAKERCEHVTFEGGEQLALSSSDYVRNHMLKFLGAVQDATDHAGTTSGEAIQVGIVVELRGQMVNPAFRDMAWARGARRKKGVCEVDKLERVLLRWCKYVGPATQEKRVAELGVTPVEQVSRISLLDQIDHYSTSSVVHNSSDPAQGPTPTLASPGTVCPKEIEPILSSTASPFSLTSASPSTSHPDTIEHQSDYQPIDPYTTPTKRARSGPRRLV